MTGQAWLHILVSRGKSASEGERDADSFKKHKFWSADTDS